MPAPENDAASEPSIASFDARAADLGLALSPAERANALRIARTLRQAAALLRDWAAKTPGP